MLEGSLQHHQATFLTRCKVPAFAGAYCSRAEQQVLWVRFYTAAPPRQRRFVERYKGSQESLRALARRCGFKGEDGSQVAVAQLCQGSENRSEGASLDGAFARAGGCHRGLSQAYAVAAQ